MAVFQQKWSGFCFWGSLNTATTMWSGSYTLFLFFSHFFWFSPILLLFFSGNDLVLLLGVPEHSHNYVVRVLHTISIFIWFSPYIMPVFLAEMMWFPLLEVPEHSLSVFFNAFFNQKWPGLPFWSCYMHHEHSHYMAWHTLPPFLFFFPICFC